MVPTYRCVHIKLWLDILGPVSK